MSPPRAPGRVHRAQPIIFAGRAPSLQPRTGAPGQDTFREVAGLVFRKEEIEGLESAVVEENLNNFLWRWAGRPGSIDVEIEKRPVEAPRAKMRSV